MDALGTVHRLIEAVNRHEVSQIAELLAPGVGVHDPFYPEPLQGGAILQDYTDLFFAFPDVEYRLVTALNTHRTVAGEAVLVAGRERKRVHRAEGTAGSMLRPLCLPFGFFTSVDSEGLIREEHRYYDVGSLLDQLAGPREPVLAMSAPMR